jgi:hypothetical protein
MRASASSTVCASGRSVMRAWSGSASHTGGSAPQGAGVASALAERGRGVAERKTTCTPSELWK